MGSRFSRCPLTIGDVCIQIHGRLLDFGCQCQMCTMTTELQSALTSSVDMMNI